MKREPRIERVEVRRVARVVLVRGMVVGGWWRVGG